jgi:hypothetical protein
MAQKGKSNLDPAFTRRLRAAATPGAGVKVSKRVRKASKVRRAAKRRSAQT